MRLAVSGPIPIPDHEWTVQPPMFTDAMPVEAVMPIARVSSVWIKRKCSITERRRKDFPVPITTSKDLGQGGGEGDAPADPV
jgi:hypothetical protein